MECEVITKTPHSEGDIMQGKPIKYAVGKLRLTIPMFSYRASINFDKSLKILGLLAFPIVEKGLPPELGEALAEVYEDSPSLKLFDPGLGLPYYLVKNSIIQNIDESIKVLETWIGENPTLTPIQDISKDSDKTAWDRLLTDYICANITPTQVIELFNHLIWLQFNIKKKVLKLIQTGHVGAENTEAERPLSPATVVAWESLRKKRLQRSLSSSS